MTYVLDAVCSRFTIIYRHARLFKSKNRFWK